MEARLLRLSGDERFALAPGMAAPVASVTVPEMLPYIRYDWGGKDGCEGNDVTEGDKDTAVQDEAPLL